MKFHGSRLGPFGPIMGRPRCVHKLLYLGVVLLCIISCWNARLLYKSKDGDISPKHAALVHHVMGQRDTLFETVNLLKAKCTGENRDGRPNRKLRPSRNSSCSQPQLWTKPNAVDLEKALVLGYQRNERVFLTVGIPTILRPSQNYLENTLDSLIDNMTPDDQLNTVLVIFLADTEGEKRYTLKNLLTDRYLDHLENGLIQVIEAPAAMYPPLKNLKANFGDSESRVFWRSKQVVDFAFMFLYAQPLSDYYMQLEDDVITTSGWVRAVGEYIDERAADPWVTLEFSVLGFIGKLFRSSDLDRLAQFLMFFYQDQPVDFLYKYFNFLSGQTETYLRAPTLFQHMGKHSSLKDKTMDAVDQFFEPDERQYRDSDNPRGKVYSSMEAFNMYVPKLCYSAGPGFFWTKQPQENDFLLLVFDVPTLVSRVAITTGSTKHPSDTLSQGSVGLSPSVTREGSADNLPECSPFVEVGTLVSGQFNVDDIPTLFPEKVACLRILVLSAQDRWLVVREIAVWTPHR